MQDLLDFFNQPDMAKNILTQRFQPTAQDVGNAALAGVAGNTYVNPQSYADDRVGDAMKQMALVAQMQRVGQTADLSERRLDLMGRQISESERHNRAMELKGTTGSMKPLPSPALKMQNEALQDLQIAQSIKTDLGNVRTTIKSGGLNLGPVENIMSAGKNYLGMSDPNSRNFATFKATLQKLRNDSLRLNKGTQTEGDAIRAWDEILANINDPAVVDQRLAEIEQINDRAAEFKKLNIDTIRNNFGHDPFDFGQYESTNKPAIMNTRTPAAPVEITRPNAGGGNVDYNTALQQAQEAIAAGADPNAVMQRLQGMKQ